MSQPGIAMMIDDEDEDLAEEGTSIEEGPGEDDGGEEQVDNLDAAWAATTGAGGDASNPENSRVLDQSEIDNLLGIQEGDDSETERSGIEAIIDSGMVSYERLPMLEVVFDRIVRMMSTSLRNFTSDNVEVSLDDIASIRFGDYLNSIPLPAMLTVFKVEEWDNFGLITGDSSLIYSIGDVLLGGRRGTSAMRIEGRPYTTIERNLVERLINVVLTALGGAFDPLASVTLRFDRLETNPRFATIARPANAAIVARFRIDMEERGGCLELLLPYATLEPVRELLLQMFMGEKFGRDSIWENHLATELWFTDVELDAVLDEVTVSLKDVLNWEIGSRLELQVTPDTTVDLRCGENSMFRGRMGRKGGAIAVRIDQKLDRPLAE